MFFDLLRRDNCTVQSMGYSLKTHVFVELLKLDSREAFCAKKKNLTYTNGRLIRFIRLS